MECLFSLYVPLCGIVGTQVVRDAVQHHVRQDIDMFCDCSNWNVPLKFKDVIEQLLLVHYDWRGADEGSVAPTPGWGTGVSS